MIMGRAARLNSGSYIEEILVWKLAYCDATIVIDE